LKYEELISFLHSHFQGMATVTNVDINVRDYDDDENAKQSEKEIKEQSAESPGTETTDESVVKSKRESNTKNLRKSKKTASAVLMKYILERKQSSPRKQIPYTPSCQG
jgi:hypothetical protein